MSDNLKIVELPEEKTWEQCWRCCIAISAWLDAN
jgi:hypothetical protein